MPTLTNKFKSTIRAALTKILLFQTEKTAKDAKVNASFDQKIVKAISVPPIQIEGDTFIATLKVDASKETGAPEAPAFEFGSGIWGKLGRKYPIVPVESDFLAFNWPDAASIGAREGVNKVTFGTGGRVILPGVMHPGVKARPYLKPAVEKNQKTLLTKLANKSASLLADAVIETKVIIIK